MSEVVLRADKLAKKFVTEIRKSMRYGVADITRDFFGLPQHSDRLRPSEFWAVDDVSFELRRGECLGIIGPNGAGKSTLLKLFNGIVPPDKGRVSILGRTGALIEVGAGFHPLLTGRENIYINGSIIGLTKAEIDRDLDRIIDFAELSEFIDMPVSYYSSGMYVRLGFAIAAQLKPDLLLIDEILAVGDVGFRAKCYGYISEVLENSAIVFVSHAMAAVGRICNRVMVLDRGVKVFDGDVSEGVNRYYSLFPRQASQVSGTGEATVHSLRLLDHEGRESERFEYGEPMTVEMEVEVETTFPEFLVSLSFNSLQQEAVAQCHSGYNNFPLLNDRPRHKVRVRIPQLLFNPGHYYFNLIIFDRSNNRHLAWHKSAKRIEVFGGFHGGAPVQWRARWEKLEEE